MYQYRAFGLNIRSELALSELVSYFDASIDALDSETPLNSTLDILLGPLPAEAVKSLSSGACFDANRDWVTIDIPFVARYWVSKHKIIIDANKDSDISAVRLLLLNNALGIALWWHRDLVFHAAAFTLYGETWVALGDSGAGKSELSAQLSFLGCSVLSDELSGVTVHSDNGHVECYVDSGASSIQLWGRSLDRLDMVSQYFSAVRHGLNKYFVPLKNFTVQRRKIDNIVLLSSVQDKRNEVRLINGYEKIQTLIRHCYRNQYLDGMGLLQQSFAQCAVVSNSLPLYHYSYDEFLDRVSGGKFNKGDGRPKAKLELT